MSALARSGGFSTSATGFAGSDQTLRAGWKLPCSRTSALTRVLDARSTPASHASIVAGVVDSIGIVSAPAAGGYGRSPRNRSRSMAGAAEQIAQPRFGCALREAARRRPAS
jgi:hypothetical protein